MTSALVPTVLHSARWETDDVRVLRLHAADAEPLPLFECGAHVDVRLPGGTWRSYSLVSSPQDREGYEIAVQRGPTQGAQWLAETLREGQTLVLRGPGGGFGLPEDDAPVLFIAGGIGITPFLSMIEVLHARQHDWRLIYGVRSRSRVAFASRLMAYGGRVSLHCDDENQGRPLALDESLGGCTAGTHICACGPPAMMREVEFLYQRRPGLCFHREAAL